MKIFISISISTDELLTKVDVMPAQAPAASLPITESSPSFPLNKFYKFTHTQNNQPNASNNNNSKYL